MMLSLRFSIISITIVRLLFVFDIFSFNRILHYRINQIVIQSALINPIYTVDHIIEANAIRQLKNNNNNNNKYKYNTRNEHQQNQHDRKLSFLPNKSFWKAYEGNQIHLPPIMLSFMELIIHPIMLITSDYWFQVIIKFLVTFVDLLIAYQLESMARKLIQYEDNIDTRETIIMKQMDSRILPEYMSLFPNVSSMNDHHLSYVPDHDDHEDITGYNKTTKENAIDVNEETEEKQLEENEDETSNGMQEPFFILFRHEIPFVIAQMYYMNPTSILSSSCIGSFQNLRVLLLVSSLNQSIITYNNNDGGSVTFAVFLLAIASYIDIHLIIFILPVIFFIHKTTRRKINVHDKQQQPDQIQEHVELKKQQNQTQSNNPFNDWRVVLLLFALYYISFHIMSYRLVGGRIWKDVFVSTHLYSFQLNGSEPNLSTLWYLGMELFNRFRLYFTILLGGIPYTLIIPITIRFYNYPAVLVRCSFLSHKNLNLIDSNASFFFYCIS